MEADDSLQKLTPIRGRKLISLALSLGNFLPKFTEANPDKGTKTDKEKAYKDFFDSVYRS